MERWTFLVIADDQGAPTQLRMTLRVLDDPTADPTVQVRMDGTEVPVDDVEKDFEAPEWRALELFRDGGGTPARWEQLKEDLRARVPG